MAVVARDEWSRRYPDREAGPYTVTLEIGIRDDGRPVVISVRMEGDFDAATGQVAAVTAQVIRLPLQSLVNEYLEEKRAGFATSDLTPATASLWTTETALAIRRTVERSQKATGRPRLGDDTYRRVADVYTAALRQGLPPTKAVALAERISQPTAATWVRRARERGFLPKTTRGRARAGPAQEEE